MGKELDDFVALVEADKNFNAEFSVPLSDDEFKIFTEALEKNKSLKRLKLSFLSLDPVRVSKLVSVLKDKPINELVLYKTYLTDEGLNELSGLLQGDTLQILDVGYNRISQDGVKSLAKLMKTNNSIVTLNLRYNNLRDTGILYLSQILETNEKIKVVDFSSNKIGDRGAGYMAKVLKTNKNLKAVNLSHNAITDKGYEELCMAREVNDTLLLLDVTNNKMSLRKRIKSEKIQFQKTLKTGFSLDGMKL
mmetsp:Transcript_5792/g.6677  ORF Transcript_5792/g.6677 Transcript_5792/m.6677 type:complete len:249 (+) Transcript_5792:181-927(+)